MCYLSTGTTVFGMSHSWQVAVPAAFSAHSSVCVHKSDHVCTLLVGCSGPLHGALLVPADGNLPASMATTLPEQMEGFRVQTLNPQIQTSRKDGALCRMADVHARRVLAMAQRVHAGLPVEDVDTSTAPKRSVLPDLPMIMLKSCLLCSCAWQLVQQGSASSKCMRF